MTRVILLLACAAWSFAAAQPLRIGVFGLFHPAELKISPWQGASFVLAAGGAELTIGGGDVVVCRAEGNGVRCSRGDDALSGPAASFTVRAAEARFVLAVPGRIERRFQGTLELASERGVLVPVVTVEREAAVASVVAAESLPDAPLEELKAQAVAARSYFAAARGRHALFDFCDTTHCQFLREPPARESAAWRATAATHGLVLAWREFVVPALYSASCGGRTATPVIAGEGYPFFAVECPYCARSHPAACSYCTRANGAWPNRRGAGRGHGIGLCQAGATAMARAGARFDAILDHYFPNTVVTQLPAKRVMR